MAGLIMKYFVLKPKGNSSYAIASRAALRAYAGSIAGVNPQLADALNKWAGEEAAKGDTGATYPTPDSLNPA